MVASFAVVASLVTVVSDPLQASLMEDSRVPLRLPELEKTAEASLQYLEDFPVEIYDLLGNLIEADAIEMRADAILGGFICLA